MDVSPEVWIIVAQGIVVRSATIDDLDFVSQDGHISREVVRDKVGRTEVVVATLDGREIGYARVEFLWSVVPYLSFIWVLESDRRQGAGEAILAHLESRFEAEGHSALFSSSQADEPEPQAWHRHMGFEECGFIGGINGGGVGEVFFRKVLSCKRAT